MTRTVADARYELHTEFTSQQPTHQPFVAHATLADDGKTVMVTSPIIVAFQTIPPRCRRPRVHYHYNILTAHIPLNPPSLSTALTYTRSEDVEPTRLLVDVDTGAFFKLSERAINPAPCLLQVVDTTPPDDVVRDRINEWPTLEDNYTQSGFAPLDIIYPEYLDNGRRNPLATGLNSRIRGGMQQSLNCVEPTGEIVGNSSKGYRSHLPYYVSFDDITGAVTDALHSQVGSIVYVDHLLYESCRQPEVRFGKYGSFKLFFPKEDEDPAADMGEELYSVTRPINPLDKHIRAALESEKGIRVTPGAASQFLTHLSLEDAYRQLWAAVDYLRADLIGQIQNPNVERYLPKQLLGAGQTQGTLSQSLSDFHWKSFVEEHSSRITDGASVVEAMEKMFPHLKR